MFRCVCQEIFKLPFYCQYVFRKKGENNKKKKNCQNTDGTVNFKRGENFSYSPRRSGNFDKMGTRSGDLFISNENRREFGWQGREDVYKNQILVLRFSPWREMEVTSGDGKWAPLRLAEIYVAPWNSLCRPVYIYVCVCVFLWSRE